MGKRNNIFIISAITLMLGLFNTNYSFAQVNGFVLTPSGTTDNFMKYVPMIQQYNGTNYITGFLTLSAYQVQLGANYDPGTPVQKLQMQGGNILLCKTFNSVSTPDFNPTSRNGAILFADMVNNTYKHGKWGIEYDNQYSTGGLNFFKPVSQLTSTRINFNLFLSNSGNVGIGSGDPVAKLQVTDGDIFIEDINRGIIMKSPDGNCWRGTLNNQGQMEFTLLPDCLTTPVSDNTQEDRPLFRISPNPASGFLQIGCTSEELSKFSEYSLFDSAGKLIKSGSFDKTICSIDIQGLAPGTYILKFTGTRNSWSEKVIVR